MPLFPEVEEESLTGFQGGDKVPAILPLDGEGGLPRSGKTEGVNHGIRRINLAPTPSAGHAPGLRRAEQSPGLFLGSSAPIKGENR